MVHYANDRNYSEKNSCEPGRLLVLDSAIYQSEFENKKWKNRIDTFWVFFSRNRIYIVKFGITMEFFWDEKSYKETICWFEFQPEKF